MGELTITSETYQHSIGNIAILQLQGRIDQKSVAELEEAVGKVYDQDISRFILDLENTTYLNSTGLGLLINITHQATVAGGGVRLINVADKFKVMFDTLGLQSKLPILTNKQEAVASFSK